MSCNAAASVQSPVQQFLTQQSSMSKSGSLPTCLARCIKKGGSFQEARQDIHQHSTPRPTQRIILPRPIHLLTAYPSPHSGSLGEEALVIALAGTMTAFAAFHLYLCAIGMTTIEFLTRPHGPFSSGKPTGRLRETGRPETWGSPDVE